jgi:hypothetical protein
MDTTAPPRTSLLGLPRELRQLIYEFIPHVCKHSVFEILNDNERINSSKVTIIHVISAITVCKTCRAIAPEWPVSLLRHAVESADYGEHAHALKLIVEPESFGSLASETGFLVKACRWSRVLEQPNRERGDMTFAEFKRVENILSWDTELLRLTKKAGESMARGALAGGRRQVSTMTMSDPNTPGSTLEKLCACLVRDGAALGSLAAEYDINFTIMYWPQKREKFWYDEEGSSA